MFTRVKQIKKIVLYFVHLPLGFKFSFKEANGGQNIARLSVYRTLFSHLDVVTCKSGLYGVLLIFYLMSPNCEYNDTCRGWKYIISLPGLVNGLGLFFQRGRGKSTLQTVLGGLQTKIFSYIGSHPGPVHGSAA